MIRERERITQLATRNICLWAYEIHSSPSRKFHALF